MSELPDEGWGELVIGRSTPRSGMAWTESGRSREDKGLKHRPAEDTRVVPAHPELVGILREHVRQFGIPMEGRLFVGRFGGLIDEVTYHAVWKAARLAALTEVEVRSRLARWPYDLRHAAVSTWLNAGVPPTQVAEWAGNGVAVLLRTCGKCIVGQDEMAKRRIAEALAEDPSEDADRAGEQE